MEQNANTGAPMTPVVDNKQKSGNGLKIATAIACIAAICGIGFGVYGIMQVSEKDSQISNLKAQVEELEERVANIDVISDESVYEKFANSLANNNSTSIFGYYYHWDGSDNERRSVVAKIENAHLTITGMDKEDYGVVFAEVDDAIGAYYVTLGNGGVPYIYIIKKDGGVARINLSEGETRTVENLDGYKDIVSIVSGSDLYAHLIDINGNVYKNS